MKQANRPNSWMTSHMQYGDMLGCFFLFKFEYFFLIVGEQSQILSVSKTPEPEPEPSFAIDSKTGSK